MYGPPKNLLKDMNRVLEKIARERQRIDDAAKARHAKLDVDEDIIRRTIETYTDRNPDMARTTATATASQPKPTVLRGPRGGRGKKKAGKRS